MIITINGVLLEKWNHETKQKVNKTKNKQNKENIYLKLLLAGGALSTGDLSGLEVIVDLVRSFAYYIGLGYATWGCVEYAMDNPGGADRVKRAIIGFIGIYVMPVIFSAIRTALS